MIIKFLLNVSYICVMFKSRMASLHGCSTSTGGEVRHDPLDFVDLPNCKLLSGVK